MLCTFNYSELIVLIITGHYYCITQLPNRIRAYGVVSYTDEVLSTPSGRRVRSFHCPCLFDTVSDKRVASLMCGDGSGHGAPASKTYCNLHTHHGQATEEVFEVTC